MKYKVLIVEDDINYRYAVKETIPWRENGFEIAGEVIHGRQALDFLAEHEVDIVLSDMSMPLMNGVELTRRVKKSYPDIIVIALSAYDDFQFVKESLKCGAEDYILKQEMNPEEIIQILKNACKGREQKREKTLTEQQCQRELLRVLNGEGEITAAAEQYLGNIVKDKCFFVLQLNGEGGNSARRRQELFKDPMVLFHMMDADGSCVILHELSRNLSKTRYMEQIKAAVGKTDQVLQQKERIYASKEVCVAEGIKAAAVQLGELREIETYVGGQHVFSCYEYESLIRKRKKDYCCEGMEENAFTTIDQMRRQMGIMSAELQKYMPDQENANKSFLNFCRCGMKSQSGTEWDEAAYYYGLCQCSSLSEKVEYTLDFINKTWQQSGLEYQGKSPEILKALRYIYQYYNEEISLSMISRHVGLSENYFSNLFKAEVGENLTYYINCVRIRQAKHLMDTTNMRMYEVAEAVGYKNPTYFSTMFKKITKTGVSDYRRKGL